MQSNHPLSPGQINLAAIFSVKDVLLSRGFEVIAECDASELLITENNFKDEIWNLLYNIFLSTKFRSELKNLLYRKKEIKSEEIKKLVKHPKFVSQHQRFDNTFEWFAGELMVNQFAAFSHSFGVSIKDIKRNTTNTDAGDFDSLVVLRDTNLAYSETKAGSFDGASIEKCYERMLALNCKYSILFCVEKIDQDKLIWDSQKVKIPIVNLHNLNKISIKGVEQDIIYEINNCYILDMTGNIENKIRTVIRINTAKINSMHNVIGIGEESYNMLGYNCEEINQVRYK